MARLFAATDTTMPIPDTHMEIATNVNTYGVIAGCAVTLDAADLTYDVAAGRIVHNGVPVNVSAQANAGTLVADSTNPRWTWIALDSTGTEVMVSGTAAATPSIPELGDYVPVMLVYVAAGGTIASSQTNYDQRAPITRQVSRLTSTYTHTQSNTTLANVPGAAFFVGASEVWSFEAYFQAAIPAAADIKVAFTVPSGATITGMATKLDGAGIVNVRSADFTSAVSLASAAAGVGMTLTGTVVNSSTAGTVQLQVAQDTSDASDVILYLQSFIVAHRTL